MKDLTPDFINNGIKNAQNNTWSDRYTNVMPAVKFNGATITYSTSLKSVDITPFDEVVLTIVLKFLFVPVWLVKQWYGLGTGMVGSDNFVDSMIQDWIDIGIVWKEAEVTGEYLRPTYALFQMFQTPPYRYYNIPFNTLRHTICEEHMMFDVMTGGNIILKHEKVMPRISELGFEGNLGPGTNIISEEDFRNPELLTNTKKLLDAEHQINEGIKNGDAVTLELRDFRYFTLVQKIDSTGNPKKDLKFHIPDLIIPVPRKAGKPMSIAIEMELSNKKGAYTETMLRTSFLCIIPSTLISHGT